MTERITEKTIVALPIAVFWGMVVTLVVAASVSTAAFVSIKMDIAQIGKRSVSRSEMQSWIDVLRDANTETGRPLRVPGFPQPPTSEARQMALAETKN